MYTTMNKKLRLAQFQTLLSAAHWAKKNNGEFVETCPRCSGTGGVEGICNKCQGVGLAPVVFKPDILPTWDKSSLSIRETVRGYLVGGVPHYFQEFHEALEKASQAALRSGRQFIKVYNLDYTVSFYRDPLYRAPMPEEIGFPPWYGEL